MSDKTDIPISSKLAYSAFRAFLSARSEKHPCEDLDTLWSDMTLVDDGDASSDPAVLGEWKERWGPREALTVEEALRVAVKFLCFERNWSKDYCVSDILKESDVDGSLQGTKYWQEWLSALERAVSTER